MRNKTLPFCPYSLTQLGAPYDHSLAARTDDAAGGPSPSQNPQEPRVARRPGRNRSGQPDWERREVRSPNLPQSRNSRYPSGRFRNALRQRRSQTLVEVLSQFRRSSLARRKLRGSPGTFLSYCGAPRTPINSTPG